MEMKKGPPTPDEARMNEYRVETILTKDRTLTLEDLPFRAGDAVEVTIVERAAPLPDDEEELLREIHRRPPGELQRRYDELVAMRRAETLTPEEYAELLRLTDEVETHNTRRVESLVKLSLLRNVTVDQLMKELDLRWPENA
jgi:hypothetical protein